VRVLKHCAAVTVVRISMAESAAQRRVISVLFMSGVHALFDFAGF
jgi:hypothetical protein